MFGRNSPQGILPGLLDVRVTSQKTSNLNYSSGLSSPLCFILMKVGKSVKTQLPK